VLKKYLILNKKKRGPYEISYIAAVNKCNPLKCGCRMYNMCALPTESVYGLPMIVTTNNYFPKQTDLCNEDALRFLNYYNMNFKRPPIMLLLSEAQAGEVFKPPDKIILPRSE
jgi:hypothetical protein